jgi:hypothetical protein
MYSKQEILLRGFLLVVILAQAEVVAAAVVAALKTQSAAID